MLFSNLYNITIPKGDSHYNLFVETTRKYTLDELKERLYKENISEDIKDDISFATNMCVENANMKFFFIKNGFKVIELREE